MTADELKAWMTVRGLHARDLYEGLLVHDRTVDLWRRNGTRYIVDVALNATWGPHRDHAMKAARR